MKTLKTVLASLALVMGAMVMFTACGSSNAPKKPKGIILQEGDPAVLTNENGYTTIEFPANPTSDDMKFYDNDFIGYMLDSNAPMTTSGDRWESYSTYYYMHNAKEWLHQGIYESPNDIKVSQIKKITIANNRMRLREFNTLMPLLDGSKEKKNDQGYQNEVTFGETYYIFIDIELR